VARESLDERCFGDAAWLRGGTRGGQVASPTVSLDEGILAKLDPRSGRVVKRVRTPGQPSGVLAAAGAVWVSMDDRAGVIQYDARDGRVLARYHVGAEPRTLAKAYGAVWVADQGDDAVGRLPVR